MALSFWPLKADRFHFSKLGQPEVLISEFQCTRFFVENPECFFGIGEENDDDLVDEECKMH